MIRLSISIPEDVEQKIVDLRKTDKYCRCSYSEIVRQLLERGIKVIEADKKVG